MDIARKLHKAWERCIFNLRALKFRTLGNVRIGQWNKFYSGCRISTKYGGTIDIGTGNEIHLGACLLSYGGSIIIGNNCSINPYTVIYGHGKGVRIGNDVLIAGHCMIIPSNHNIADVRTLISRQGSTSKGIIIDDNVWIGANCTILDGVRIFDGAVIAAGSVVNKDVLKNSVVAGVPIKHLKFRDDIS